MNYIKPLFSLPNKTPLLKLAYAPSNRSQYLVSNTFTRRFSRTTMLNTSWMNPIGRETLRRQQDNKGGKGSNDKKGGNDKKKDTKKEDFDVDSVKELMQGPINNLKKEYESLRAARASPSLLDKIQIETPTGKVGINSIGQVSVKDPQTLHVNLFDEKQGRAVENAIRDAKMELMTQVEGSIVKIKTPKMTNEYRESLVKLAAKHSEAAKVSLRSVRKNALDALKKSKPTEDEEKQGEKRIQTFVDDATKTITTLQTSKTKEIQNL